MSTQIATAEPIPGQKPIVLSRRTWGEMSERKQLQSLNWLCYSFGKNVSGFPWEISLKRWESLKDGIMVKEIDRLRKILDDVQQERIYTCIRDVVSHGIVPERFKPGESLPTRQDATHFILAWLKHSGVPADRCRKWMISYCERVLSPISSSSPSRIRHSTKSVIKYIYRSEDASFDCGCEQNELKATCDPNCPLYGEMQTKYRMRMEQLHDNIHCVRRLVEPPPESLLQVKERHQEQFEKAMDVVREQLKQQASPVEITRYLNDHGYSTRTGRPWTVAILRYEIKKHKLPFSPKKSEKIRAYAAVKTQYRGQYQEALELIRKLYGAGVRIKEILAALEAQQYKTITGKKWTEGNIRYAISKLRKQPFK